MLAGKLRVYTKMPFVGSGHRCIAESRTPILFETVTRLRACFQNRQVEVDAPGGESLAFTLRHGEEDGIAVVGFCRENENAFPDEQECVVTLMQEISSWRL